MVRQRVLRIVTMAMAALGIPLACGDDDDPAAPIGPAGPPARIRFITSPAAVQANTPMTPAVQVVLEDQNGNPTNGEPITIQLDQQPRPATLLGTTVATGSGTGASFDDLRIDRPGAGYTLRVNSGSLTATSEPFDVQASFSEVTAGGPNADYDGLSCGIAAGGTYCWGANADGQAGAAAIGDRELAPSLVIAPVTFVEVSTGGRHACGRTANGAVRCWGRGVEGQLGDGSGASSAAPLPVAGSGPTGVAFSSISAGHEHTCGLTSDGAAYCWGSNAYGELGDGSKTSRHTPLQVTGSGIGGLEFVSLSAGDRFTCGTTTTLAAWCWGDGRSGELGHNAFAESSVPVQVAGSGTGSLTFERVSVGLAHACAITAAPDAGRVYCWGLNLDGALGDGSSGNESKVPVLVNSSERFTEVSAATNFTCALSTTGSVWCWGRNFDGELGIGTRDNSALPVRVTGAAGLTFTRIRAGGVHACAVASGPAASRGIYCWGANYDGRLGDGTMTPRLVPTRIVQ